MSERKIHITFEVKVANKSSCVIVANFILNRLDEDESFQT